MPNDLPSTGHPAGLNAGRRQLATVLLLLVLPTLALSFFAVPAATAFASDFAAGAAVREHGLIGAIAASRQTRSGTITADAAVLVAARFGLAPAAQLLPVLLLLLTFVAWWGFASELVAGRWWAPRGVVPAAALTALFATHLPSPAEGLYVLSTALPVQGGTILTLLLLTLLLDQGRSPFGQQRFLVPILVVVLAGLAGTCHRPGGLLLCGILLPGYVVSRWCRQPDCWRWAVALIVVAVAQLLPLGPSPALVASGQSGLGVAAAWLRGVAASALFLKLWLGSAALWLAFITAVLLGPFLARSWPGCRRVRTWHLVVAVLLGLLLLSAVMASEFVACGPLIPKRTLNTLYVFVLSGGFAAALVLGARWHRALGRLAGRRVRVALGWVLVIALALEPGSNFLAAGASLGSPAAAYRRAHVGRDQFIRQQAAAGVPDLVVPRIAPPPVVGTPDLFRDPAAWPNQTAARYYGVSSLAVVPPPATPSR